MFKYLIHRPKWVVVVFGLLVFWLTQKAWFTGTHVWQQAEGTLIDYCYHFRGPSLPDPRIKLIGIGTTAFQLDTLAPEEIAASPTLKKMQEPWPWDRSIHAAILEKLMAAGAKVVMFDFVFASEKGGDDEFAKALEKYKDRVVIGEMLDDEEGATGLTKKLTTPNPSLLLPGTEGIVGLVNVWKDDDLVVRRARYRTSIDRERLDTGGLAPGVVAVMSKAIADGSTKDDLIHAAVRAVEKYQGHADTPPPETKAFINFQGPASTYRAWPVENMFVDALWNKPPFKGGLAVSNKIVIVGPMAEIMGHDVHLTPFGETPGPEIQAQIVAALLQGQWLAETSDQFNFWLSFGAVAVALLIGLGVPQAFLKALLLALATVGLVVTGLLEFAHFNHVVPLLPPLFCLVATSSFGIIFEYALEQIERRRYRHIFNRYVSKNVADVILADRRSAEESMRGIKKPVTVLFSDIRGFTTMTEKSDATKLVAQLNEYFAEMVDVIYNQNSGTLQKFIGDAIMAAWGDTYTKGIDVDARRAVTAALQMRAALAKLNSTWKDNPDRLILATGIGVNHGEVIYGNIGSKERTELTVLGDGVNLAARLESATKQFHTDILIGQEVEKLTREHFVYRTVDLMTVKGKTKPVEVFALVSDRSVPSPEWLATYEVAVKLYRNREFKEAADRFKFTQERIGGGDFLCEMYLSRCKEYQSSPPPADWDGSYTLSEK